MGNLRKAMAEVTEIQRVLSRTCSPARIPRLPTQLAKLQKLADFSAALRSELCLRFAGLSTARRQCVDAYNTRFQALRQRCADLAAVKQSEDVIIAEWHRLGRLMREECARQFSSAIDPYAATQYHFDSLRDAFLRQHDHCIRRHLRRVFPGSSLRLVPVPVSLPVQAAFLRAWRNGGGPSLDLRPAFHGTRTSNLPSIFDRGLLIPGIGNTLKVVHGAAHGRGIYAAKVYNPFLSAGFATGIAGMLVVAVLDDAVAPTKLQQLGGRSVRAESALIRHVGDAMVAFDPSRVLPFFSLAQD